MSRLFEKQQVLVTGGSAGIGRATARAFAHEGAHVIIVGRDESRAQGVVLEIGAAGGSAEFRVADLASATAVRALVGATGPVDVLVCCAGFRPAPGPAVGTDEADLDSVWAVNVRAPWMLTAGYAPTMAGTAGSIVHVSSGNAVLDQEGFGAYNMSKAALNGLVRAFAHELGRQGTRVNAVAPGPTRTPYTDQFGKALEELTRPYPLPRPGQADEVAAAILFLASPAASHITGAVLPVDGGQTIVI